MKQHIHKVLSAGAPVFAAMFAIAVVQATNIGFPLVLSASAWAEWLVFATLVYASSNFILFLIGCLCGPGASGRSQQMEP